jgi:hypothetical protein
MTVAGVGRGKDFKLWPGGGREWNWTETGTHHEPGIQPADVRELLEHGCRVVVLSRGMWLRLGVCGAALELLESEGAEIERAETKRAVAIYNDLAASGTSVGGLFHSTC